MHRSRLAALLAAAAAAALGCAGPRSTGRASPLVGTRVEIAAKTLEGRDVPLPARGAAVTVVDFWATWCEPCRDQLPELERLQATFRDAGVEVFAISFDEDRAAVEEYVARTPVGLPVLWDKGGERLAEKLAVTRLPTTVLLDREGVVRSVHLGYDKRQASALDREVRQILAR